MICEVWSCIASLSKIRLYGGTDINIYVSSICKILCANLGLINLMYLSDWCTPHLYSCTHHNGLDNIQWAYFILDLLTKLRIINRIVPGFATGSPCSVGYCGWTTCLLNDGPFLFFMLCFYSYNWCAMFALCRIFSVNFLSECVCTLPKFCQLFFICLYIYSEITYFYIKYFVRRYAIDVVTTLSYWMCYMFRCIPSTMVHIVNISVSIINEITLICV